MATEPVDSDFFSGKIVHFWSKTSGMVLVGGHFETIGGRLFVVGTTPQGWPGYENKPAAIAWGEVATFYLYETVEEWQASQRTWQAAKRKKDSKSWFSFG